MATGSSSNLIGSVVSWGISEDHRYLGNLQGIVVGWNENKGYEKADCRNEVGSKIGEVVYDVTYSVRATIQIRHGVEIPTPSTVLTINNKVYRYVSGDVTESNQDYTKISVTLEASAYDFTPVVAEGVRV